MEIIKTFLIQFITRNIFNLVDASSVLRETKDGLYYKGRKLNAQERTSLIQSARELKNNYFFNMLMDDMYFTVNKKMQTEVNTLESLRAAKTMLFVVDLFAKKVDNISNKDH